jgi:hypothetical protein
MIKIEARSQAETAIGPVSRRALRAQPNTTIIRPAVAIISPSSRDKLLSSRALGRTGCTTKMKRVSQAPQSAPDA